MVSQDLCELLMYYALLAIVSSPLLTHSQLGNAQSLVHIGKYHDNKIMVYR